MDSDISKYLFKVTPNLMSHIRCHIMKASEPSFSFTKFRVLANVNRGICNVSEIAHLHGVSQPAISKIVDSLVVGNFLSRHHSLVDRRKTILRLTSDGRKKLNKIKNLASKTFEPTVNLLSEKEKVELTKSLTCIESFFKKIEERKS